MCGIAGFNWEDKTNIERMTTELAHRGPDARGTFVKDGVSLGHTRLSVIDFSTTANQPMIDADGELTIVFNGEIYNFQKLRNELKGYPFKTNGDTEVILAGYKLWGDAVVERLHGMFAFAIYDARVKRLICARDRAGVKPFYYFWDGARFIFASEMKALFAHTDIPRTLSREAFNQYIRILYAPEPLTMVEGVAKLPPGHLLTLADGAMMMRAFDDLHVSSSRMSYREATVTLREKVTTAVERHMVADVPIGVYLSGGIDSSAVLASMALVHKNVKTFSVGFTLGAGEEGEKFNHDFNLAKQTAAHFGTEHHAFTLSARDALDAIEEVAIYNSDPVSNPTSTAMLLLAHFAKREVGVVLTGSGGDELFGGYDRYRIALLAEYYQTLPVLARRALDIHPKLRKLDQSITDLFAQFMFQKDATLERVIAPSVFQNADSVKRSYDRYILGEGSMTEHLMAADRQSWLPDYFFALSDHMSMAGAIEERVPLVDDELVAFARSLPRSYKLDLFRTKKILKDAFCADLPATLFDQPKRGWFSPGAKWLRDPAFATFAREVLSSGYYAGTRYLFNWPALHDMLERHIDKREYNLTTLWAILTFQLWARVYQIS